VGCPAQRRHIVKKARASIVIIGVLAPVPFAPVAGVTVAAQKKASGCTVSREVGKRCLLLESGNAAWVTCKKRDASDEAAVSGYGPRVTVTQVRYPVPLSQGSKRGPGIERGNADARRQNTPAIRHREAGSERRASIRLDLLLLKRSNHSIRLPSLVFAGSARLRSCAMSR